MPVYTLVLEEHTESSRSANLVFESSRQLSLGDEIEVHGQTWQLLESPAPGTFVCRTPPRRLTLIDVGPPS